MEFDNGWQSLLDPGRATDFFVGAARLPRFEPTAAPWNVGTAWWLAELSRVIYCRAGREGILAAAGWRQERFFEAASTQCAVVRPAAGPDCAVLVFRGTDALRDWFTNVRAALVSWPGEGRVHYGFRRALAKVWPDVEAHLRALDTPTYFTGHSLGGALATMAAALRPPRATYTFGAPRVGDAAFTAALPAPIYRVVNRRDIVPALPPERLGHGYAHGGELHHLAAPDAGGAEGPDGGAAAEALAALGEPRRWFDPHATLADHAPVNYIARLAQLATG